MASNVYSEGLKGQMNQILILILFSWLVSVIIQHLELLTDQ